MEWQEFEAAAPALARLGRERMEGPRLVLVGTIRKDGTPRISPVEPLILAGRLYLGMMWRSTKALDLLRDPRCLVHSIITGKEGTEGEFKLRGRA
ncbi:MAG TPA: pyridoxamine 5'-phosphate oxidase family protein, partial [Dehalococcoidia bacterium]